MIARPTHTSSGGTLINHDAGFQRSAHNSAGRSAEPLQFLLRKHQDVFGKLRLRDGGVKIAF
jgi:hypothetical protein